MATDTARTAKIGRGIGPAPIIKASFAGGEYSPELHARVDLAKYSVGAALLENWMVDYRGGIYTRQGTQFITSVKFKTKHTVIRPFIVGNNVSYVMELGDLYVRFIVDKSPLVEATKAISAVTVANPAVFTSAAHGYANGQWVVLRTMGGMPLLNGVYGIITAAAANTFQLTSIFDGTAISTLGMPAYSGGGTAARVYELVTPWTEANLDDLKFGQSADVLTIVHPDFAPRDLTRLTASTFALSVFDPGPQIASPTALTALAEDGGSATHNLRFGYTVTAIDATGKEESLPSTSVEVENASLREFDNAPRMNDLSWTPVSFASYYNIYKWGGIPVDSPSQTVFGFIGQSIAAKFTDNNIAADITRQPPQFRNPFAGGAITAITILTPGSGYGVLLNKPVVTITGDGTGAKATAVVDLAAGGEITQIIITDPGEGYTTGGAVVTLTGAATTDATASVTAVTDSDGIFPSVVSYYQQRRFFAASEDEPFTLWGSQIGLPKNFDVSPAVLDNEAVTFSLSSTQVNDIVSLVATSQGLIGFTAGGIWLITGETAQKAITPSAISALPQDVPGASDLQPISVNTNILYVQSMGSVVRDVSFNLNSFSLSGKNRSELAQHLVNGYSIDEWCFAEEPFHMLWAKRSDGYIITMTFVPEQDVYAWARQSTDGLFESLCCVPEPPTNAVYMIVRRYLNGVWQRYIERVVDRTWKGDVEKVWSLDCALQEPLTYPAANITLSAVDGNGVIVTASSAVFGAGDVGKVLRAGGGRAAVAGFTDTTHITVDVRYPFPLVPQSETPLPYLSGEWSLDARTSTVTGLQHLAGVPVWANADGNLYEVTVSATGSVTLPHSHSLITIGLNYEKHAQTLPLDTGEPTIQGKYKVNPAVTARITNSRGLQIGPSFDKLVDCRDVPGFVSGAIPIPLQNGDSYTSMRNSWNKLGQICLALDVPFAAEVLGLIPEVVLGSDG